MNFINLYNRLMSEAVDTETSPNPDPQREKARLAAIAKHRSALDKEGGQTDYSQKNRRVLVDLYIYLYQITNGFTDRTKLTTPEVITKLKQFIGQETTEDSEHKMDFGYKRFMDQQVRDPHAQKLPTISLYAKVLYIIQAAEVAGGGAPWQKIAGTNWKDYKPDVNNVNIGSLNLHKPYFRKMAEQYYPTEVNKLLPLTPDEQLKQAEKDKAVAKANRLAMIKAAAAKIKGM